MHTAVCLATTTPTVACRGRARCQVVDVEYINAVDAEHMAYLVRWAAGRDAFGGRTRLRALLARLLQGFRLVEKCQFVDPSLRPSPAVRPEAVRIGSDLKSDCKKVARQDRVSLPA